MTKKQSRSFRAEEKTKIVLEVIKEEVTIAQLSSRYGVTIMLPKNWTAKIVS